MPIAAEINGRLYAIHTDHLNTPRRLTNQQGQVAWQWLISGFGEVRPTTGDRGYGQTVSGPSYAQAVKFDLRYPGQVFDEETGLSYNLHRYYDAATGRYIQADPIGLEGGWNRFGYVGGNPLNYIDPEGLVFLDLTTFEGAKRKTTLDQAVQAGAWTRLVTMPSIGTGLSSSAMGLFGSATIPACSSAANWYMLGSEADTTFLNLTFREKMLYEVGQKTTASYARYAKLSPVERGAAMVSELGWWRALVPEVGGLSLGIGSTFGTGPTPWLRWLLPKALGSAGLGAALSGDAEQCSCGR
ncbi:RHS repeat-associated core domain-containing protein [Delftia sp. DLF01]|uniref:RHS repeat-associated core domain-containing protein n=1 Tax=Delftia sp. DLF01 TaxID=2769279 RepID=UPI00298CCDBB|nr:RHS repeat-associated core domain-containing protein [Delftia sp. DLF01]